MHKPEVKIGNSGYSSSMIEQDDRHSRPQEPPNHRQKLAPIWRAVVEVAFIIFLFYSNLLMGEFTRSRAGQGMSLVFAIRDIFTIANFEIGLICALIGFVVFEYLRNKI
jgi:hypothetical protein